MPREELGEIVASVARELAHMGVVDWPMTEKEALGLLESAYSGKGRAPPQADLLATKPARRHVHGVKLPLRRKPRLEREARHQDTLPR